MRTLYAGEVGRQADQFGVRSGALVGLGNDLVTITEAVDKRRLERFVGEQRPAVDRRAHRIRRQLAGLGNAADDLPSHRGEQIFDLFAVGRGHLGFGQNVGRGLVGAAMVELGDDPEQVKGAL